MLQTLTTIETWPIDDLLHNTANHSSPDSSNIPAFISPDNVKHVAIWRAATAKAFKHGLKAGVELAEKQMKDKFKELENTERHNRQILLLAEVAGKEEGVNKECARWLAVYPDIVFSEFNEETFPETVSLAPAAKPSPPVTHSIATQATYVVPQVQFILSPPISPPTNETLTQTESFAKLPVETRAVDMTIQIGHSPIATNDLILLTPIASPPILSSISLALPILQSAQSDSPHGWADNFDDPYLASNFNPTIETYTNFPGTRFFRPEV
jgi:hypothetical protein